MENKKVSVGKVLVEFISCSNSPHLFCGISRLWSWLLLFQ